MNCIYSVLLARFKQIRLKAPNVRTSNIGCPELYFSRFKFEMGIFPLRLDHVFGESGRFGRAIIVIHFLYCS